MGITEKIVKNIIGGRPDKYTCKICGRILTERARDRICTNGCQPTISNI